MLQIGKSNISTTLTQEHKEALDAYFCAKLREVNKADIITPIKSAVQRAYIVLGQGKNMAAGELTLMLDELIKELKTGCFTFTIEEVCLAIDAGVKGKLNELKEIPQPIISVTNIIGWIWIWNEKVRVHAIDQQKRWEEKNNEEEIKRKRLDGNNRLDAEIEKAKENFKENSETLDQIPKVLRACYYRRIREKNTGGLLERSLLEQIKAVAEAQHDTFEELPKEEQKHLTSSREVEKFNRERDSEVKITAQSIALKEVFKLK